MLRSLTLFAWTTVLLCAAASGASAQVVTNTSDSGAGSLRAVIGSAPAGSTITFASGVTGTITLASTINITKNLTIQGPGANILTVSGNNAVRVFNIANTNPFNFSPINVTISGLTIANGRATVLPGGGGIRYATTGTLNLIDVAVTNNTAALTLTNILSLGVAGGVVNTVGGTVNILRSTFSGNTVGASSTALGIAAGGAVANDINGTVNITNSTFTGNVARVSGTAGNAIGGAVANLTTGTVNITNATISGNTASATGGPLVFAEGGGIANQLNGTFTVKNTIIAQNTATTTGADVFGTFTSLGYNLIGNFMGGTGFVNGLNNDQVGAPGSLMYPLLAPLGYYGGTTQTMALLPGSPAIDAGMAAAGVTTDQRGVARPVDFADVDNAPGGNASDIGAFELRDPEPVPVPGKLAPANVRLSDQKAGSLLVFPYYTSDTAGDFAKSDTFLTITNASDGSSVSNGVPNYAYLHLFFMKDCSPADTFVCLTPNGSFQFLASAYDPATTGYMIAVAVDADGVPVQNNSFIGSAFVRDQTSGVIDSYQAESFAKLSDAPVPTVDGSSIIVFDGINYEAAPLEFSVQLQDPSRNDQTLVLASIAGDLGTNLTPTAQGNVGIFFRADEHPASYQPSLGTSCFIMRAVTSQNFRIVPGGLNAFFKDSYGYLKFNVTTPAVGLLLTKQGATGQAQGRFSGIRTLHKTATMFSVLAVPVFSPFCG